MADHSSLTGAELHENKGAAAASDDQVATVTSGATVWKKLTTDNLDTSSIFAVNGGSAYATITDISTSGSIYLVVPFACTVDLVYSVIDGALATADATLTIRDHSGGSMGTITVGYSGSAAGDVDSLTPATNNTLAAGEHIQIDTDGASTNTVACHLTFRLTRTA
jgi:hypothetical protein